MRKTLAFVVSAVFLTLVATAAQKAPAKKQTKSAAKNSSATVRKTTPTKKKATTTASRSRRAKKAPVRRVTWRNRQLSPEPERYREIQAALAAKGYLGPEGVTGAWGSPSVEALKRFQADQNIQGNGKINSLSLIALGLGPKRDTAGVALPVTEAGGVNR